MNKCDYEWWKVYLEKLAYLRNLIMKVHRYQGKEFALRVMKTLQFFIRHDQVYISERPFCLLLGVKLGETRAKRLVKDTASISLPSLSHPTHNQRAPAVEQAQCQVLETQRQGCLSS